MQGKTIVNRYDIRRKLGAGSFGSVYEAVDINNNNKVAVKFIDLDALKKQKFTFMIDMVTQEYNMIRQLHEKNVDNPIIHTIPEYYSKFEIEIDGVNYMCIVMENIVGKTLEKMYNYNLLVKRQFDRNFLTRIFTSLLATLLFLHKNNIVHRDIKPENVIYNKAHDRLVLIDYGFICSTEKESQYVCKGNPGSLRYAAPEIVLGNVLTSDLYRDNKLYILKKADVWSAGVTIAQLANLREPYSYANTRDELEEAMLNGDVERVLPLQLGDEGFVKVVNHAITYGYKKRPTARKLGLEILPAFDAATIALGQE